MLTEALDFGSIPVSMRAHQILGVPYTDDEIAGGIAAATEQAAAIAAEVVTQGGPEGLEDKRIVALIAYLQRLGTDITKPAPMAVEKETGEPPAEAVPVANETVEVAEVAQ
jgi:cytochrome c oxidase cbb3-type subunit I/II